MALSGRPMKRTLPSRSALISAVPRPESLDRLDGVLELACRSITFLLSTSRIGVADRKALVGRDRVLVDVLDQQAVAVGVGHEGQADARWSPGRTGRLLGGRGSGSAEPVLLSLSVPSVAVIVHLLAVAPDGQLRPSCPAPCRRWCATAPARCRSAAPSTAVMMSPDLRPALAPGESSVGCGHQRALGVLEADAVGDVAGDVLDRRRRGSRGSPCRS